MPGSGDLDVNTGGHGGTNGTGSDFIDNMFGWGKYTKESKDFAANAAAPTSAENAPTAADTPEANAGREAQQRALDALNQEVVSGGWSPQEKAAYAHQSAMAAGMAAGHQASAVQQMVARGMSPGLANHLAANQGQQNQAQAGYQGGLQAQGDAELRATAAAGASAQLADQMQSDATGQNQFNTNQGIQGILATLKQQTNTTQFNADQAAAQQSTTAGAATTTAEGALGVGHSFDAASRANAPTPASTT